MNDKEALMDELLPELARLAMVVEGIDPKANLAPAAVVKEAARLLTQMKDRLHALQTQ